VIELCHDATASVATNAAKADVHERTLSGERPVENSFTADLRTALEVLQENGPVDVDDCSLWHGIDSHAAELAAAGEEAEKQELKFDSQSGIVDDMSVMKMSTKSDYENVQFRDQTPAYAVKPSNVIDETRKLQDANDATLDNFFRRPIKIHEQEWGTSTTLAFDIDPWALYFNNPRVINRIANYNLLRAKLNIKVVVNGNGFQYGRALCAYQPLNSFDQLSTHSALVSSDLVQTSQLPKIFLDPTTSTGGEMELPFFWYENYLNITSADWSLMGQLYFRSLNDLKHANGATDQVTVSVFAWADDVSMSVLTSENPLTLTPQSGVETETDEANKNGMISKPATAIAKMSNALSKVPAIRPYALATETAALAVASVARQFGYCRPPVTKNPDPFRSFPTSQLATTNTPDTALKLSVDDKQELSIDPRLAGLGDEDPLSIKEIAKRESYLTKFSWNIGTTPETLLWNARIDPVTWAEDTGPPVSFHLPACAMAALPFKYWTGSMRFRFQVVCSAFHKGRLKIVYDPNFLSSNEYNTNYLQVIDIADTQDFTIEVGNGQSVTLLDHHLPGVDSVTQMYSTTAYTAQEEGNGVLGVYVVNELTTPNSTANNDIEINVFVSMGDDFEVFVPDDHFQRFVFKPQSGEEVVTEAQNTAEPSAPLQENADNIGPGQQDNALINMVYTGESIMSFRTMLKRYTLWRRDSLLPSQGQYEWSSTRKMFPFLRGNVAGAVDQTGAAASYNYVNTLLLHWVTNGFSGWRGGVRYKMLYQNKPLVPAGSATPLTESNLYVERRNFNSTSYTNVVTPFSGYADKNEAAEAAVVDGFVFASPVRAGPKGALYANTGVNPTAEFEVPFYSPLRFAPAKRENYTTDNDFASGFSITGQGTCTGSMFIDSHVAAAEDFQVYFWTGLPRLYYELSPPAA
jgi:hypothetical protein